jgi:hypothetical protein
MVGKVFGQRNQILKSSTADMNVMQSVLAKLAAGVGMNITEFRAQIVAAWQALQSMQNSTGSGVRGSSNSLKDSARSLTTQATVELQDKAVQMTLAAQNSNRGIEAISTSLMAASSSAATASVEKAASASAALSGAVQQSAASGKALLSSLGSDSTIQSSSASDLSRLLSYSHSASSALASQISFVNSNGNQQLSVSNGAVYSAIGAVLTHVKSFLASQNKQLTDHLGNVANTQIDRSIALIENYNTSMAILSQRANELGRAVFSMANGNNTPGIKKVIDAIDTQIRRTRDMFSLYTRHNGASMKQKLASVNSSLVETSNSVRKSISRNQALLLFSLAPIVANLTGTRDSVLSTAADGLRTAKDAALAEVTDIAESNVTLTDLAPVTEDYRTDKFVRKTQKAERDLTRASLVNQAAVARLLGYLSGRNASMTDPLPVIESDYHAAMVALQSQLAANLSAALSQSPNTTSIADLNSMLSAVSNDENDGLDLTTSPNEEDDLGHDLLKSEDTVNTSSVDLDQWLERFIQTTASQSDIEVMLPVFKLVKSLREYAKVAQAGVSPSRLAADAVGAAAMEGLAGVWSSASTVQAQALSTLKTSQAETQLQITQAASDAQINSNLAKQVTAAAQASLDQSIAVSRSVTKVNDLELQMSQLQVAKMDADWNKSVSLAAQNISERKIDFASLLGQVPPAVRSIVDGSLINKILQVWSDIQPVQVSAVNAMPAQAKADIGALAAAVQTAAAHSSSQLNTSLRRIASIMSQIETLKTSGDTLGLYPQTARSALVATRASLSTMMSEQVAQLKEAIDDLLQERMAQAADNVLSVYSSLNDIVSQTQSTSINFLSGFKQ